MVLVVAVVGMPGSGKGVLSELVKEAGIPVFSMGDMIRAEVEARGLEGDPHVFGRVAQELRDEFGYGVLASRLAPHINSALTENQLVLIEGLRGGDEKDVFLESWPDSFKVIAVNVDADIRFNRISARGRAEDGDRNALSRRDERELGWGVGELIAGADWSLDNSGDLETFKNLSEQWLNSLFPSH